MHPTVLTLLPVAGVLVLILGHLPTPGTGVIEIHLALPDGAPVEGFLDALGVALEEPVRWNANVKEIRRQRLVGETALVGSKSYVLGVARALLTFYELRLVTLGPPHKRVHVVTRDAHTCGLGTHN